MIVSDDSRMLFVHVQKTGGLTVQDMLTAALPDAGPVRGLAGGRHAGLGAALRVRPELADYFVFGFVRNPWARMYSWYAMVERRRESAEQGDDDVAARIERNNFWAKASTDYLDFEAFVMQGPTAIRRLRTPQLRYLRARGHRAGFIGRTETLDADLATVFARLGLPAPVSTPHKNTGPPTDYREHYTAAMRDRIGEIFAEDVRAFGYEF